VLSACHAFLEKRNRDQEERTEGWVRGAMQPRGLFKRTRTREEAEAFVEREYGTMIRITGINEAERVRALRDIAMASEAETVLVSAEDFRSIRNHYGMETA
jgi:hypothetical protein